MLRRERGGRLLDPCVQPGDELHQGKGEQAGQGVVDRLQGDPHAHGPWGQDDIRFGGHSS
ncbi:MAG: hypothetical protein PVG14_14520 [Anaerolineales bacterium]